MFQNVGISYLLKSTKQLGYDCDKECTILIEEGIWYNKIICPGLCGSVFEYYFITAWQYRYALMYDLNDYENIHENCSSSVRSGGGTPLPK